MDGGLSSTEWVACVAVFAGFLLLNFFLKRRLRDAAEKAGAGAGFERSQKRGGAYSLIFTGAMVGAVCAYSWRSVPPGNERLVGFMLALGALCAGLGAYRLWRLKRRGQSNTGGE